MTRVVGLSVCMQQQTNKQTKRGGGAGAGIAQLVNVRLKIKSGAILTRVTDGAARDFSPRVTFHCRLSYGGCTAPPPSRPRPVQSYASRSVCTLKIPNTGSHTIHTLIRMDSAALLVAVP